MSLFDPKVHLFENSLLKDSGPAAQCGFFFNTTRFIIPYRFISVSVQCKAVSSLQS